MLDGLGASKVTCFVRPGDGDCVEVKLVRKLMFKFLSVVDGDSTRKRLVSSPYPTLATESLTIDWILEALV